MKLTNVTRLGRHLTSAFGIADVKAYLGLQRSDDLNPVFVCIWSAYSPVSVFSPNVGSADQKNFQYGHFSRSPSLNI